MGCSIQDFIAEGTAASQKGRVKTSDLYAAYVRWAERSNAPFIETHEHFGKKFRAGVPYESRLVNGRRVYLGMELTGASGKEQRSGGD
jgi:phage/plasmid-associated DNA primase